MYLEGIMSKWNKSDRKERQVLYDFIYMWNIEKKNRWTNMTKQKHTINTENKQVIAREEELGVK